MRIAIIVIATVTKYGITRKTVSKAIINKAIYIPICNLEKLFSVLFFGDSSESLPTNKQEATIRTSESNA